MDDENKTTNNRPIIMEIQHHNHEKYANQDLENNMEKMIDPLEMNFICN